MRDMADIIPCRALIHRENFEYVVDHAEHPRTSRYRFAVREAKRACIELCPVREECLAVHGQDYDLGVIAGFTDQERAAYFEASA